MQETSQNIPRIIHYCWFGNSEFPPLIKKCMATWEKHLTDWKIIRWDESNIPADVAYLNYALEQKLYAFAADYMRFHVLHQYGGIYLDTDIEVIKDLSPLLCEEYEAFASSEAKSVVHINGAVLGGKPQALFFKKAMEKYTYSNNFIFQPIPKILNQIQQAYPNSITILPFDYFYPYNPYDCEQPVKQLMYCDMTPNTYTIHHWYKSWKLSKWQKFRNSLIKRIT